MMNLYEAYLEERPRRRVVRMYVADMDRQRSVVQRKIRRAISAASDKQFTRFFEALDNIDSTGFAEAPSQLSLDRAREILHKLATERLEPIKITPAAEGGVAICLANRETYADIECLNSGEILGVTSNRRDHPTVWEVQQSTVGITSAVARIKEFLGGAA